MANSNLQHFRDSTPRGHATEGPSPMNKAKIYGLIALDVIAFHLPGVGLALPFPPLSVEGGGGRVPTVV